MTKFIKLLTAVVMIAAIGITSSCKKTFDNPPGPAEPNIVANTSIKDLKAMHTTSGAYNIITTDIIISGVVVADDKSGNFYKQLFIEDSTGGLQVLLDANSLYGTYPVGRRIYIRCNGLCISDYNGTMELGVKALVAGLPSLEGIPANLVSKYVVGGTLNNPVTPHLITSLSQLTTSMQDKYLGALIQLDNFAFADLTGTYSDTSAYKSTVNRDIKNCSGQTVIVRTSAYANFAADRVPQGRGTILAIYTTYGTTKQLIIRDTTDVSFNDSYSCPLPPGTLFLENFESVSNNVTLNLPGWKNVGETGNVPYAGAVFGSTKCGKITAFSTGAATVSSWLITPAINLTGTTAPNLNFLEAAGYALGATTLKVMVSTNYTGSNTPSTATWTTLSTIQASTPTTGYATLAPVSQINLSAYIGQTIYIAFKYDGSDPTKTTTYEIDDVTVKAN